MNTLPQMKRTPVEFMLIFELKRRPGLRSFPSAPSGSFFFPFQFLILVCWASMGRLPQNRLQPFFHVLRQNKRVQAMVEFAEPASLLGAELSAG